jgi:hypothetical protein
MGFAKIESGEQVAIFDKRENRKKEASYLDCAGDVIEPTSANEEWNTYEIENEKDFNTIPGMPLSLPGPFV